MTLRSRLGRLRKQLTAARPPAGPVTVFLVVAGPGQPVGRREVWGGAGVEITYDPAAGPPELPPGGPHKLIVGGPAGMGDLV
jgi:hypothetical protein